MSLYLNGNVQFLFLCNPWKSSASRVCITFLQITQKILTEDIIHCVELITEILSFLQIFSVKKTTTQLFYYIRKSIRKSTKKIIFLTYFGPVRANYKYFMPLLTLHCFFLTLITIFLCMSSTIYSYGVYYFLILCFYF